MAVIQVAAIAIVILYLAYFFKERIVDVLPIAVSLLVLLLYLLAFVRQLSFLDYINVGILFLAAGFFLYQSKEKKHEILIFCRRELLHPGCMVAILVLLGVSICVSGKAVTWWDDINFWATDAKAIFYLDGFAGKYSNVAAEFGDYPPGTQMLKWWFLHLSPSSFKEGLMFSGYYVFLFSYMMPLMRRLKGRNIIMLLLMAVMLWLFPSVAEEFYLTGSCADLAMGAVYGAFLAAVMDERGHSSSFYYGRLTLYLMILVLIKNIGFIWAGFGIIFLFCYRLLVWKKEQRMVCASGKQEVRALGLTMLLPVVTEAGWLLFCLSMRRVAKLTGTAISMAAGGVRLPEDTKELIHTFLVAFFEWPLHRWKTWAVDLSPFALYLIICLFVLLYYKKGIVQKHTARLLGSFLMLSGFLFYSFNLISHLTIFAIEEQYLQPFGMVSSIERYGAPFMIGGLYLLGFLWLNLSEEKESGDGFFHRYSSYLICFALIFVCADHKMAYEGLIGYRTGVTEVLQEREQVLNEPAKEFLRMLAEKEETGTAKQMHGLRILYLRDGRESGWVQNTYISFEAAPISMMYGSLFPERAEEINVSKLIDEAHAKYLYVDDSGEELLPIFEGMVQDGNFCYNTLYKVKNDVGTVRLLKEE